jgi:hypothetical protein
VVPHEIVNPVKIGTAASESIATSGLPAIYQTGRRGADRGNAALPTHGRTTRNTAFIWAITERVQRAFSFLFARQSPRTEDSRPIGWYSAGRIAHRDSIFSGPRSYRAGIGPGPHRREKRAPRRFVTPAQKPMENSTKIEVVCDEYVSHSIQEFCKTRLFFPSGRYGGPHTWPPY